MEVGPPAFGTVELQHLGHIDLHANSPMRGLIGEAIPIEARIVAVADTYDVLTFERPYRTARSRAEARCILEAEAGTHLDPKVVAALLNVLDKEIRNREPDPAVELKPTRKGRA